MDVPGLLSPIRPPDQRFRQSRNALTTCNSRIRRVRIFSILSTSQCAAAVAAYPPPRCQSIRS
ncbi:hypothetical protein [Azospirillum doebereinerae]